MTANITFTASEATLETVLGPTAAAAYNAEADEIAADYAMYSAKKAAATTAAEKTHYTKMIYAQGLKLGDLDKAYGLDK